MRTISNTANVTDFSGESPVITYSNTVVTLIRQTPTSQIYIPRNRCNCNCNCCGCNGCNCGCSCCRNNPCLFNWFLPCCQ